MECKFLPSPCSKTPLKYCLRIQDISDIKLIGTDATLDLSQKTEKQFFFLVVQF